jgi:hypothetical protein
VLRDPRIDRVAAGLHELRYYGMVEAQPVRTAKLERSLPWCESEDFATCRCRWPVLRLNQHSPTLRLLGIMHTFTFT